MLKTLTTATLLCLAAAQTSTLRQSTPATATRAVITPAPSLSNALRPCCWFWAGFTGVQFNSWYPDVVRIYTAITTTTFLKSGGRVIPVNSTINYLPANKTFSGYGFYNRIQFDKYSISLPGVPTDLITMDYGILYAGTSIIPPNQTYVTVSHQDARINSPTPWILWNNIRVTVDAPDATTDNAPPRYATQCGIDTTVEYVSYSANTWSYYNTTQNLPQNGSIRGYDIGNACANCRLLPVSQWITPLSAAPLDADVLYAMPPDIADAALFNKTLLKETPWLSDCYTFGGEGQPTVHIQVTQLTTDVSYTITAEDAVTPQPVPDRTASLITTQAVPAASLMPQQAPTSVASGAKTLPSIPLSAVLLDSTTAAVQLQSSVAVIAGQSVTVDGPAITVDRQTISLVSRSSGLAILIDGTTTQGQSPTPKQTIAVGNTVVTIAAGASGVAIDGVPLQSGQSTVVNGQTIALAGTNIVVASGGTTTTQGIGPAILNGLGGGSSSSRTPYTSFACGGGRGHVAMVSGVLCLLAFWF